MVEVKFLAENFNGQLVSGVISAENMNFAKVKTTQIAEQHSLKIKSIKKKSTYIYRVRKGSETPIRGEQSAFDKSEVIEALTKLGYEILSIQRKLFKLDRKPSDSDILMYVKVSAEMLEQNLSYGEIMSFLISDTRNKVLRETIKDINKELKKGVDSQQVFMKHEPVLGKFTAFMLGLASKSGNMSEIYMATAKFLERKREFRKNIRSALISPLATLFVLIMAIMWYVGYIFPETAKLFQRFKIKLPPMTSLTLQLSYLISNNILIILMLFALPVVVTWRYYKTKTGREKIDKLILKIPVLGELLHKTLIEIFCRVFYTLYSGSAESITPIKVAAEAPGNKYFEARIKDRSLSKMMKSGIGIAEGLQDSGVFFDVAISKFRQGEETGNIQNNTLQLANYYESDTTYRLKNFVEFVQTGIAIIILIVMILLTLVSAETATIQPKRNNITNVSN